MRRATYRLLLAFAGLLTSTITFAQHQTDTAKMLVTSSTTTTEGIMRSNNKIYVVMAVCLTILVALILYLIRIDRKIIKLEKLSK